MNMSDKVRDLREARNWSQAELAARVGVSQVTIAKIETGKTTNTRHIGQLAKALGVTPDSLLGEEAIVEAAVRAGYNPPPEIFGPRDLPVYASVEGGPGAIVVSTDPIDMVPRPWFFRQVREGYAVLVNGESMSPVYEPGDMVLVNPRASLVNGKDVILVKGEEEGRFDASLKRLVGQTPAEWMLRQFSPPEGERQEFRRLKREWPRALRVVGKYDGG